MSANISKIQSGVTGGTTSMYHPVRSTPTFTHHHNYPTGREGGTSSTVPTYSGSYPFSTLNSYRTVPTSEIPPAYEQNITFPSHPHLTGTSTTPIPSTSMPVSQKGKPGEEYWDKLGSLGIGLTGLFAGQLLSHPAIILRRQCQVTASPTSRYNVLPFHLPSLIYRLHHYQGTAWMWKGLGSIFIVRGLVLASETILSEITSLPKEIPSAAVNYMPSSSTSDTNGFDAAVVTSSSSSTITGSKRRSLRRICSHLILKAGAILVTTPFFAASFVEVVQSKIASEEPGLLDTIWEGLSRLSPKNLFATETNPTSHGRLIPVFILLSPVVLYGVLHYIIVSVAQYSVMAQNQNRLVKEMSSVMKSTEGSDFASAINGGDGFSSNNVINRYLPELTAAFAGNFMADVSLFPLETVMHRLFIQGTRCIIDNTDASQPTLVCAIKTNYTGFADCAKAILKDEGCFGFYKGFGALVLQYSIQVLLLRLAHFTLNRLAASKRQRHQEALELLQRQAEREREEQRRSDAVQSILARHSTTASATTPNVTADATVFSSSSSASDHTKRRVTTTTGVATASSSSAFFRPVQHHDSIKRSNGNTDYFSALSRNITSSYTDGPSTSSIGGFRPFTSSPLTNPPKAVSPRAGVLASSPTVGELNHLPDDANK